MCPGGLSGGPGVLAGGPGVSSGGPGGLSGGPGGLSGCSGCVWCLWFHLAKLCLEAWVLSLPSVLGGLWLHLAKCAWGLMAASSSQAGIKVERMLSGAAFEGVKHVSKSKE